MNALLKLRMVDNRFISLCILMKKYTMLGIACLDLAINAFSLVACFVFSPIPVVILVTNLLVILLVVFIQAQKRLMLLEKKEVLSQVMMGLLITFTLYFTVMGLACLIYLNELQKQTQNLNVNLGPLLWEDASLSFNAISALNLTFYLGNLLVLGFYSRAYYIMFWLENIVFIYRYLKDKVKSLNSALLAHLPTIAVTKQLQETICPLCIEHYTEQEVVTRLFCSHVFHKDCIRVWVIRSNGCPLCRQKVVLY